MIVLAVDPGSRFVALIVRDTRLGNADEAVRASHLLDREEELDNPDDLASWAILSAGLARELYLEHGAERAVVEAVVAPRPYAGGGRKPTVIDPAPILEAALVAGAVVAETAARLIPPAGFGAPAPSRRVLEAMYPPSLIGARETTGAGKGPRQHLRAAWDLALAGASAIYAPRSNP